MICRLRRQEPSLSSIKEKSFESRRVRTQPRTSRAAAGSVRSNAAFTDVGGTMARNSPTIRFRQVKAISLGRGAAGPVGFTQHLVDAMDQIGDPKWLCHEGVAAEVTDGADLAIRRQTRHENN